MEMIFFARPLSCKSNSFPYEKLSTRTRFETEVKMAYYMPEVILACGGKRKLTYSTSQSTFTVSVDNKKTMRAMESMLTITLNSLVAAGDRKYKTPTTSMARISSRGQLH